MSGGREAAFAEAHLPAMRREIMRFFKCDLASIRPTNPRQDMNEATDLVLVREGTLTDRIACRARSRSAFDRYGWQITFRTHRPLGPRTEWSKIMSGYGEYNIYVFSEMDLDGGRYPLWLGGDGRPKPRVVAGYLMDLRAFRVRINGNRPDLPSLRPLFFTNCLERPRDLGVEGAGFDVRDLGPEIVPHHWGVSPLAWAQFWEKHGWWRTRDGQWRRHTPDQRVQVSSGK